MAHFLDDGGEKNRERGECHVGEEEHEGRKVGFWILDRGEDLFDLHAFPFFLGFRGRGIVAEAQRRDAFLASSEIVRC